MTASNLSASSAGAGIGLTVEAGPAPRPQVGPRQVRALLYSSNSLTRDSVRLAVGRRPAADVEVTEWLECATAPAVMAAADAGGYDLFVLDGEASPFGGMGLCRKLKDEIFQCPPVVVLTGRVHDAWLAAWSYADVVVPHPLDPIVVANAVAEAARRPAHDA